jgi:hypothetical protein
MDCVVYDVEILTVVVVLSVYFVTTVNGVVSGSRYFYW